MSLLAHRFALLNGPLSATCCVANVRDGRSHDRFERTDGSDAHRVSIRSDGGDIATVSVAIRHRGPLGANKAPIRPHWARIENCLSGSLRITPPGFLVTDCLESKQLCFGIAWDDKPVQELPLAGENLPIQVFNSPD